MQGFLAVSPSVGIFASFSSSLTLNAQQLEDCSIYLESHWLLLKETLGATSVPAVHSIEPRLHPNVFSDNNKKATWKNCHCSASPFMLWYENVSRK